MDKRNTETKGWKTLIWLGLLIFFVYSYKTNIDLEEVTNPRRHQALIRILTSLAQPNLFEYENDASRTIRGFSETSHLAIEKMWETIQIAFLATGISAILAGPFAFIVVRGSSSWVRGFNTLLQPILAAVRAVHPLMVAIPTIILVGIGPTAGTLALTFFSTPVLIESFAEYARHHTSLNWPDLLKVYFPGIALRYFPASITVASVIGYVGGGGIGFLFQQEINLLDYRDAGVALYAVIFSIGSIDLFSRAVWYKIQNIGISPSPTAE